MYLIYKYTNSVNGKVYIGQTSKTLEERAMGRGSNYRQCTRFWSAILEYSWESFKPTILQKCETKQQADYLQQLYIELYRSTDQAYGYNVRPGGESSYISPQGRIAISQKAKQRYKNKERCPMYGKKHSQEAKQKMREKKLGAKNPMYGKKWAETHPNGIQYKPRHPNFSKQQRERYAQRMRELGKAAAKRVVCVQDQIQFPSISQAAKHYGVSSASICDNLKGRSRTCKGKHFAYLE